MVFDCSFLQRCRGAVFRAPRPRAVRETVRLLGRPRLRRVRVRGFGLGARVVGDAGRRSKDISIAAGGRRPRLEIALKNRGLALVEGSWFESVLGHLSCRLELRSVAKLGLHRMEPAFLSKNDFDDLGHVEATGEHLFEANGVEEAIIVARAR